jgi:hypothetical protein
MECRGYCEGQKRLYLRNQVDTGKMHPLDRKPRSSGYMACLDL